ncbi:MAG: hypothetical protein U5R48_11245 [Gammaproteobacteria bacterium]|nr:hypothetical protein [Gammaproteobacteria bacterium]
MPDWIAGSEVLPEFGKHRCLTKGQASTFVKPEFAIQEASRFAGRLFKRLMYYTCDAPARFLPEVTEALTAFDRQHRAGARASRLGRWRCSRRARRRWPGTVGGRLFVGARAGRSGAGGRSARQHRGPAPAARGSARCPPRPARSARVLTVPAWRTAGSS